MAVRQRTTILQQRTDGPSLAPTIHYLEAMGLSFLYTRNSSAHSDFSPLALQGPAQSHLPGGLLNLPPSRQSVVQPSLFS